MTGMRAKAISVTILGGAICSACGQAPAAAPSTASAPDTAAARVAASALVRSSIAELKQTMATVGVDRWKMAKPVRDTTVANVESIRHDLDATLPALLATAEAQPDSVAALLPVSQNLGAFYDVLLRVTVVAASSAPQEQTRALEFSMIHLDGARRALNNRLEDVAEAEEQKVAGLQKALSAAQAAPPPVVAAAPVPVPAPCEPVAPVKKKPARKPAAKASAPTGN